MLIDNFKNDKGLWMMQKCVNYKADQTRSGRVYLDIKSRCLVNGYQQRKFPRYVGCTMSENFKDFQFFVEWHMSQIGFGLEGYQIDKDILTPGNKVYGESTCVLVPGSLNSFFTAHNARRGIYPQGVSITPSGKFQATIMLRSKHVNLGSFPSVGEAFQAYKTAKEKEARLWAERLEAGEFIVDPRVIERMKIWTLTEE